MSLTLILDILIVALLVPTILFAWVLNSRLADLRRNRDELARLIATFNDATQRAESGIPKLRRAADDAARGLQDRVDKAQTLRDDLAFMVDRADTTLGRLEDTRPARTGGTAAAAANGFAPERGGRARPGTGRGGMREGRSGPDAGASTGLPAPPPVPGRKASAGDGGEGGHGRGGVDTSEDFFLEDERSEAERELLRALQSGR